MIEEQGLNYDFRDCLNYDFTDRMKAMIVGRLKTAGRGEFGGGSICQGRDGHSQLVTISHN
jgi:hypothetical protein